MDKIQRQSFHQLYAKPILFVGVLLLLAGFYCYTRMQTNLFPEVLFPRITVIADAGQQPVDRMMITVTKPLESAVKKVQGTTVVKSSTSRGSCVIDVYFQWGLDIYALKTQLESRINEIKNFLPAGTVISTEAMNQSLFPVYGYTLESDTHSRIALRDVGNLVVRPMFSQVSGISNVVVRGGKAKEFVVKPDPMKMSALGITPAQIKEAFTCTNFVLGNGQVADYNRLYLSLTDTRIDGLEELKAVVIIMIVGILAENSIFTVWQYKTNRRNGGTVEESVDYAIALHIRPKLMTAIGAVLALMPLALGLGMGAQMQQPLAVAVIGGFVVGLPLLLIVLPALMRWIYRKCG